jgi:hypothetical protein
MISLSTAFVKQPFMDGLLSICNNGTSLAFQPTCSIWINVRICNDTYTICLDIYDKYLKEASLVSLTYLQQTLVSKG